MNHHLMLLAGFTFVKELTLDVQNVIAPPKPKSSSGQKETASAPAADANSDKIPNSSERIPEKDLANDQSEDGLAKSPSGSAAVSSTADEQSQEFQDSHVTKSSGADGSSHAQKTSDPCESPHAKKTGDADGSPVAKESRRCVFSLQFYVVLKLLFLPPLFSASDEPPHDCALGIFFLFPSLSL